MRQLRLRFQQPSGDAKSYQPNMGMQERYAPILDNPRAFVAPVQGTLAFVDRGGGPTPPTWSRSAKPNPKRTAAPEPLLDFSWTKTQIDPVCSTLENRRFRGVPSYRDEVSEPSSSV